MKFTLSWLHEFLDTSLNARDIAAKLTHLGLEIESVHFMSAGLESFTVAHILSTAPHPNADKLRVCQVQTHHGVRQIVCGAPNARPDIKVILADIGDVIPTSGLKIKASKIRDVESNGMLCSARELGIGTDDDGIMELDASLDVGVKAIDALGLNDVLFDVSITPNRGDCLSVMGIARDLAAAGCGTLKALPPLAALELPHGREVTLASDVCPHFILYEIADVVNGTSPAWLRSRLESVGMRSISTLVDITNYFMLAYGRPLHVYDAHKVAGSFSLRSAHRDEPFTGLNGTNYALAEGTCVIADMHGACAVGGIIGGNASGCSESTTHVLLEAAWFDPIAIAGAGRTLNIDTDARYRFERTVDPSTTEPFARRAAEMIVALCGGRITARTCAGEAPNLTRTIAYDPTFMMQRTGMMVEEARQETILTALGCTITKEHALWHVSTPSHRPDMEGKEDITEEIARMVGYEHLPCTPLPPARLHVRSPSLTDKARSVMIARGLDEAVHFAFTSEANASLFTDDAASLVRVRNPISSELSVMRPHLFADLLPAVARNHDYGRTNLALGEIGTVFFGCTPADQPLRACGVRTGTTGMHWRDQRSYDAYDAKADLLHLLEGLGLSSAGVMVDTTNIPPYYHPSQAVRVSLGYKITLGFAGALHPATLRAFGLTHPVMGWECWLNHVATSLKPKKYTAFVPCAYQASVRDFAFVMDASVAAGELRKLILKANKQFIRDVTIFDVYEGKNVEAGKKSVAFSVTLQAHDRTLAQEDIMAVSNDIITSLHTVGAVLR
ncbi:MAG: phenylalanine--tRNA ligase subunit beta [Alphaproteobacteria bacterium]|nr:MAG: phenylalanine--tRNA ligase subunit beta [Alphaproteobacteria bacterium]TAF40448.1 MAG: phenylalanine--tRNA ligase subunit beta [Alphaproteobacteria bacterium]TAF76488.1 MAG: phenylalanine--tRNA ligase subunit beta [Alphaproteobacteria bacterium]